jgi:hypothetical protein
MKTSVVTGVTAMIPLPNSSLRKGGAVVRLHSLVKVYRVEMYNFISIVP